MIPSQSRKAKQNKRPVQNKKLRELALYYNLAAERLVLLLNSFQKTPHKDETFWKNKFFNWKKDEDGRKEINIETFAFLKNFLLYKKSMEQPGDIVTGTDDRWLMVVMMEKLFSLRNWHSHYCHKDFPLNFDIHQKEEVDNAFTSLIEFLNQHLESAAEKCIKGEKELQEYYQSELKKTFRLFNDDITITQEGRIFFLQFFLTDGEMNRCLSGIKGFKKNNNPQWQLKRKIFSFYSKRDGSSGLAFIFKSNELEEGSRSVEVKNQLRQFSIFNDIKEYLLKKPAIICSYFEIEKWRNRNDDENLSQEEKEKLDTIRPVNKFVYYALQYLLDFEAEFKLRNTVEWRFKDAEYEKVSKKKALIWVTKTKSKPVFGSRSFNAERLFIKNGMAYFKFNIEDKSYLCSVNEQSLLYWIGALILSLKKPEEILKDLKAYVFQYTSILEKLKDDKQPDLNKFGKINPDFLHSKLNDWVNNISEEELMSDYKSDIKKKIQSLIHEVDTLTPEKLQVMKSSDKNKLLFKWYNYLLTDANKLSHIRNARTTFSEIDNLSRFHYLPSDDKGQLRTFLIKEFQHKFPLYIKDSLISKRHKNIDDIVNEVASIMKSQFEFWQKIASEEKHPPEWHNTDKQPQELENLPINTWSNFNIDEWNLLARKLNISNPSLKNTRKGSKETDRKRELLSHFLNAAIQIPKSVFIESNKISADFKQTTGGSKGHLSFAKQVRENDLSKGLNNSFYEIKPESDLPKVLAKDKPGYSAGAVVKEILYTKTTDTLLWGVCLAYHKKLFATGKLSSSADIDSTSISVSTLGSQNFNWIIGGKSIAIKQKQLKKVIFDFKLKEIETVINRGLNKEDTAEAIEKVFNDNYIKSLQFIQRSFELEEAVIGNCNDLDKKSYIEFYETLEKIEEDDLSEEKKLIIRDLRNLAFHTNIPKTHSYDEGIEIIEEFLTKKRFEFRKFIKPENGLI